MYVCIYICICIYTLGSANWAGAPETFRFMCVSVCKCVSVCVPLSFFLSLSLSVSVCVCVRACVVCGWVSLTC